MKNDDPKMKPVIDLMWSVEDEPIQGSQGASGEINANCGGCCCCSVPNVFTKWLC